MLIITLLFCVAGLTLSALAVAVRLRLSGGWTRSERLLAYATGICAAPALAGLSLLPFYLVGTVPMASPFALTAMAFLLIGPRGLLLLRRDFSDARALVLAGGSLLDGPDPRHWRSLLAGLALTALAIALCIALLSMPVMENDALEYAAVAKVMLREGSLQLYPLRAADPASGLYAPSMHPPVFHLMILWAQSWSDVANWQPASLLGQRIISVWSFIGTALLVFALGLREGRIEATMSLLMLLCTSFLVSSIMAYGIDLPRIAAFTAAAAAVVVTAGKTGTRAVVSAATVAGLAMWVHTIGFLAPFFGALALIHTCRSIHRWRIGLLYGAVSAMVGCAWYMRNLYLLGTPFSDSWPASTWPGLSYEADLATRRGLETLGDRLLSGTLLPWTDPALFGPGFWITLVGLASPFMATSPPVLRVCRLWLGTFLLLALVTSLGGSTIVIKNPRYWLTMAPLAAVCSGCALAAIWRGRPLGRIALAAGLTLLLAWTGINLGIKMVGLTNPILAFGGPEAAFLDRPRFTGGPLLGIPQPSGPARVLSFRPPDTAVYGRTPWVDHFDPGLQSLHFGTPRAAYDGLRARKVLWAYLPDYSPVTHARSALAGVLADPRFAAPVASHRNARLFAIHPDPLPSSCAPARQEVTTTVSSRSAGLGDMLAAITRLPQLATLLQPTADKRPGESFVWSRSVKGSLFVSAGPLSGRFAVAVVLQGSGVVALDAEIRDPILGLVTVRLIDGLLDREPRSFMAQWHSGPGAVATGIRITPLAPVHGELRLISAAICTIGN